MKNQNFIVVLMFCCFLGCATLSSNAGASVLTFDNLGIALNQPIPQDYGDNLINLPGGVGNPNTSYTYGTAHGITPSISVAYGSDPAVPSGNPVLWSAMGNLTNVLNPINSATVTLTTIGKPVALYGFDFAGYAGNSYTISLIQIVVDNTVQFSQTNITAPGSGHDSLSSFTSATPFIGGKIEIIMDTQGAAAGAVGFDNFDFAEVPEPGSIALLGVGALGIVSRRYRRAM
jgi:hypothetical protein